jgi:hypothetical protein
VAKRETVNPHPLRLPFYGNRGANMGMNKGKGIRELQRDWKTWGGDKLAQETGAGAGLDC